MKRIWSLCGSFCEWSFHSFIWESVTFIFFSSHSHFWNMWMKNSRQSEFLSMIFFYDAYFFSVKILKFLPYLWIIHIFIVLIIKSITLMNEYQINDHSREKSIKRNFFFRWIKMLHFHSSELPFFFSFIDFYCLKLNDGRSHMWYFGISSLFCWYFCDCVCCSILPARTFIIQFQAVKSILESDTYKHKTGLFHLSVILKIDTV